MKQLCFLVSGLFLFQFNTSAKPEFGAVADSFTGNWEGYYATRAKENPLHATVIEYKNGYAVTFRSLPDPREDAIVIFQGREKEGTLVLESALSLDRNEVIEVQPGGVLIKTLLWEGVASGDVLSGEFAGREVGTFRLNRMPFRPSPTLGEKPPVGALILFDGTSLDAWEPRRAPEDPIQWELTAGKTLEVVSMSNGKRNKQDISTKQQFGDYSLHLEFKLPHKPAATGQGRSNSGIFNLGLYETQILDSFGLYGRDNECGGIYKTREPDSNAGYPAGFWQTYDIDMTAPEFDKNGKKIRNARMTIRLNGKLIHDDIEVPKPTAGGKEANMGPIILQDHGSPVQFRNIWILEK